MGALSSTFGLTCQALGFEAPEGRYRPHAYTFSCRSFYSHQEFHLGKTLPGRTGRDGASPPSRTEGSSTHRTTSARAASFCARAPAPPKRTSQGAGASTPSTSRQDAARRSSRVTRPHRLRPPRPTDRDKSEPLGRIAEDLRGASTPAARRPRREARAGRRPRTTQGEAQGAEPARPRKSQANKPRPAGPTRPEASKGKRPGQRTPPIGRQGNPGGAQRRGRGFGIVGIQ